jgi:hypothetical protein
VSRKEHEVLLGDGDIKYVHLYIKSGVTEMLFSRDGQPWLPTTSFPEAKHDALLYLLLGGGRDMQPNRFEPPFQCESFNGNVAVLTARSARFEFGMRHRSSGISFRMDDEQRVTTRSGDSLECIGSVGLILASREHGLSGMLFYDFLPLFVKHISLWTHNRLAVSAGRIVWGAGMKKTSLGKFGEIVFPALSPRGSDWPQSLYDLPAEFCSFGYLERSSNKEMIDVTIMARHQRAELTAETTSSRKNKRKAYAALNSDSSSNIPYLQPALIRKSPRFIESVAASVSTLVGKRPATEMVDEIIATVEMNNHEGKVDLPTMKGCFARAGKAPIYILLCRKLQEDYFTNAATWKEMCNEHKHCRELNALRLVVSSVGGNYEIGLENLSRNIPLIPWSKCQHLVIVIEVEGLNFETSSAPYSHEKAEA